MYPQAQNIYRKDFIHTYLYVADIDQLQTLMCRQDHWQETESGSLLYNCRGTGPFFYFPLDRFLY